MKIRISDFAVLATLLVGVTCTSTATADLQISVDTGIWAPFLPDYDANSIVVNGGGTVLTPNLFNDDQADVGPTLGVKALYRLDKTNTWIEATAQFSNIESMGSNATVNDPGGTSTLWMASLDGTNVLNSPNGESFSMSLDSDVFYHTEYLGLRRKIRRNSNHVLSFGAGARFMRFDQDFNFTTAVSDGSRGQFVEGLTTDFIGGQVIAGCDSYFGQRRIMIDLGLGVYDMRAKYNGQTQLFNTGNTLFHNDNVTDTIHRAAVSFDVTVKTEWKFYYSTIRPGFQYTYISDMAHINHPQTISAPSVPASLSIKPTNMLRGTIEFIY